MCRCLHIFITNCIRSIFVQRQYSVTQALTVNNRKIPAGITRYETSINGQPVYGGANDPRMGDIHNASDPGKMSQFRFIQLFNIEQYSIHV